MDRAERRHRWERAKDRARRIMRLWLYRPTRPELEEWLETPGLVAHNAETHCRPCSCWMCKYKRPLNTKGGSVEVIEGKEQA